MDGILRKLGSGMQMGVVETGQHSPTVEVDHASTGSAGLQHLGVRANQNESSPVNTKGGGRRARRVDGDHDRIVDDQIWRRGPDKAGEQDRTPRAAAKETEQHRTLGRREDGRRRAMVSGLEPRTGVGARIFRR